MVKLKYPCPCPRCNGAHVSYRTLFRHHKNNQTVQSIADWRCQQGRPLRSEDFRTKGDIEGNEGAISEDESEDEGGNDQEGFSMGRAQKRGRFDDHIYQVCVTGP